MITQTYNLNLIPDRVPVIVNCSQYDANSRTIEMVIYDGSALYTIPSGTSASVRGTKSDNTGFEYPCTIDGSKVSFDIQDQMTIFAGKVPCEIRLSKDGGIIGTCNFLLNVEETPLDPEITISESDLPLLEEAEQNAIRAEQARDEAEELLSSVVKSVNGETPDADGNVEIQVSSPIVAGTGIEITNDVVTNTAPLWHGDEVGSLPVPINADQLQGHEASYFQPLLTAGTGISISNGTISNTLLHTVITPAITLSASTNITSYVPIDAVVVEVAPLDKTAFARFAKNVPGSQWWVKLTDWEDATITGSHQLEIKYIL